MWPRAWNLLGIFLFFQFSNGLRDCGDIQVSASVIHLGASVTASCTINPNCLKPIGTATRIVWKLDLEKLPESWQHQREDGILQSNITLPHFNHTRAMLSCCLLWKETLQIIEQAELKAGYPPQPPSNFSCVMNHTTQVLTCQWKSGPSTYLPTNFTLKSYKSNDNCQSRKEPIQDCIAKDGESQCSILRNQLLLYQKVDIWVKAENVLGEAESSHLCINPMEVVKLDPPILQAAKASPGLDSSLRQPGCLRLKWKKARMSNHMEQMCELQYHRPGELTWVLVSPFLNSSTQHEGDNDLCGLLSATRYVLQLRCIRWPMGGHWSDWSRSLELTTKERRPRVRFDVWWRRRVQKLNHTMMDIQLLWKPVLTEENDNRVQGYLVFPSPPRQDGESRPLCNTTELSCAFQLPERAKEVTLTAYNIAGESSPTTITFWESQGTSVSNIHTSAPDAHSLWVGWDYPPGQPLPRAYVIEWCLAPAHQEDDCNGNWKIEPNGSSTGTLLDENIMPFQLYKITVSPLYDGTRGRPQHIYAYSREKAPFHAPKLKLKHIGRTWAELEWEPGIPELGKSPITQYTVFWTNSQDKEFSVILNASSRRCILRGLEPSTMYHVHLMASNQAGGINSTDLTVVTIALEEKDINVLLILISFFSVLVFCVIITLVCLHKNHKMKTQFWPNVPDPAHSSLGQWIPTILHGETIHLSSLRDPAMPPVSKIIVLKEEEKKLPAQTMGTDEEVKNLPHLVQAYILQGDPFLPEPHLTSSDPIQYGKVMGNQGYQRQHRSPAGLYLRSDSTQPLLADLTPSPKLYENMWFQKSPPDSRVPSSHGFPEEDSDDSTFLSYCPQGPLLDFPLLQGLKIEGAEGLSGI
ncbi:granulocyte colony-stimulating factor receptor [Sarcophilus harrisii]|uniref:Colony stimulating factor 3 receptor n=1 Tax=Sarcophilus harrisii TaxID=9305 RepID=G3X148_SARHA|nr:granulocyte colony-stimulating factor receptor [Sarcophilus harrisii]